MKIITPSVTLLHATPAELITHAGRHSYQSHDKANEQTDAQLLAHFVTKKESPLKFSFAMFDVTCSYTAHVHFKTHVHIPSVWLSQRYTHARGVIVPEGLNDEQRAVYLEAVEAQQRAYDVLRELGAKRQDARYVQGQGGVVRGSVCGNALGLLNMLALRTSKKAMPETRQIAELMQDELSKVWPTIFGGRQ